MLKIAAIVVGVAALIFATAVTFGGATAVAAFLGVSVAAIGTITTVLSIAATVLSVAAGLTAKKPQIGSSGTQLEFSADPTAGIPYFMGEGACGMQVVHEATWGDKNKNLGMIGVMSLGTIFAYNGFYADGNLVPFTGANATGYYAGFMMLQTQLGAQPEAAALSMPGMPDWGAAYKLSGLAAAGLTLVADTENGKVYAGGVPKMWHDIKGVKAYDPRADSTNGGSGAQRYLNEATYAYSDNPWVHHATYAIGRWQNGIRMMGPGVPPEKVDWASHIEAANVAAANGWKISGRIMSSDSKWEALKGIAQAGGGYPVPSTSILAAIVNTPRVSMDTIEEEHVRGAVQVPQMAARRDRINGGIPRIRMKEHGWEIAACNTIRNATYLAEDGGNERTREVELPLVADLGDGAGKTQAAQLVAYDVANSREKIGITVELGLVWGQYKAGDCLTLNLPKALLFNQKCIVIGRTLNAMRNTVTLEFRTEDDAKHTWALGITGSTTTPPTIVQPPGVGDGIETDAQTIRMIRDSIVTGLTFTLGIPVAGNSAVTVSNHNRVYNDKTVAVTGDSGLSVACASGDVVLCYYDDADRSGGAEAYQFLVLPAGVGDSSPAYASNVHPYRHTVFAKVVPSSTSGTTGGGSGYGSGGGGGGGGGGGSTYPVVAA